MLISNKDLVKDIQARFQSRYPELNLKFYKVDHDHFEGSRKKDEVSDQTPLSKLSPALDEAEIFFTDDTTVDELESMFEEKYGLHVQVFRKSGDQWLQTSVTDRWPLKKHVEIARRS